MNGRMSGDDSGIRRTSGGRERREAEPVGVRAYREPPPRSMTVDTGNTP
jgi:hypothetical protein